MELTTLHLFLTNKSVWIKSPDGNDTVCGFIRETGADTCMWPRSLGEEPDWFFDELCDLVDKVGAERAKLYREGDSLRGEK